MEKPLPPPKPFLKPAGILRSPRTAGLQPCHHPASQSVVSPARSEEGASRLQPNSLTIDAGPKLTDVTGHKRKPVPRKRTSLFPNSVSVKAPTTISKGTSTVPCTRPTPTGNRPADHSPAGEGAGGVVTAPHTPAGKGEADHTPAGEGAGEVLAAPRTPPTSMGDKATDSDSPTGIGQGAVVLSSPPTPMTPPTTSDDDKAADDKESPTCQGAAAVLSSPNSPANSHTGDTDTGRTPGGKAVLSSQHTPPATTGNKKADHGRSERDESTTPSSLVCCASSHSERGAAPTADLSPLGGKARRDGGKMAASREVKHQERSSIPSPAQGNMADAAAARDVRSLDTAPVHRPAERSGATGRSSRVDDDDDDGDGASPSPRPRPRPRPSISKLGSVCQPTAETAETNPVSSPQDLCGRVLLTTSLAVPGSVPPGACHTSSPPSVAERRMHPVPSSSHAPGVRVSGEDAVNLTASVSCVVPHMDSDADLVNSSDQRQVAPNPAAAAAAAAENKTRTLNKGVNASPSSASASSPSTPESGSAALTASPSSASASSPSTPESGSAALTASPSATTSGKVLTFNATGKVLPKPVPRNSKASCKHSTAVQGGAESPTLQPSRKAPAPPPKEISSSTSGPQPGAKGSHSHTCQTTPETKPVVAGEQHRGDGDGHDEDDYLLPVVTKGQGRAKGKIYRRKSTGSQKEKSQNPEIETKIPQGGKKVKKNRSLRFVSNLWENVRPSASKKQRPKSSVFYYEVDGTREPAEPQTEAIVAMAAGEESTRGPVDVLAAEYVNAEEGKAGLAGSSETPSRLSPQAPPRRRKPNASVRMDSQEYADVADCGCVAEDDDDEDDSAPPDLPPRNLQQKTTAKTRASDLSAQVRIEHKHGLSDDSDYIIPGQESSDEEERGRRKAVAGDCHPARKPLPRPPMMIRRPKSHPHPLGRDNSGRGVSISSDGSSIRSSLSQEHEYEYPDVSFVLNHRAQMDGSQDGVDDVHSDRSADENPELENSYASMSGNEVTAPPIPEEPPGERYAGEQQQQLDDTYVPMEHDQSPKPQPLNVSSSASGVSAPGRYAPCEPYAVTEICAHHGRDLISPSASNFELRILPESPEDCDTLGRPRSWAGPDFDSYGPIVKHRGCLPGQDGQRNTGSVHLSVSSSFSSGHASDCFSSEGEQDSQAEPKEESQETVAWRKKKAFFIAREIMTSEQSFVDTLKLISNDFCAFAKSSTDSLGRPVVPPTVIDQIFKYLPILQNFNQSLLKDLSARIRSWEKDPRIADVFVEKGAFLKMYTNYIRDFEAMCQALEEARRKYPDFDEAVKQFEAGPRCQSLALKYYMLRPIQRIPQYRLLLQEYKKYLKDDSPDFENTKVALVVVSEVADHANQSMQYGDNLKKLLEIQNTLIGQFEVVVPGRFLVKEGTLQKLSRKEMQPRVFYLFNDYLLCTTPVSGGFKLNSALCLTAMKVKIPQKEDFQNEFSIISTQRSFTISASSPQERDEWVEELKKIIKENREKRYSYFIKQHNLHSLCSVDGENEVRLGSQAPVWIPDARVSMCMKCTEQFTVSFRRHHCRACGKVVCGVCSDYRAPLRYLGLKGARVCQDCFEELQRVAETGNMEICLPPSSPSSAADSEGLVFHLSKAFVRGTQKAQGVLWRSFGKGPKKKAAVLSEVTANEDNTDMSGYLKLWESKKWRKIWFVLKENVLYFYKASEDTAAYKTAVMIGYEIRPYHSSVWFQGVEPSLVFEAVHSGVPSFIFRTESPSSRHKWMMAMQKSTLPC